MSSRKLTVSQIECKDLLSVGKVGSDVYATLSLRTKGERKDYDKKERFVMPQTFGNINPTWEMSCEFGNMYPLNNCKPGSSRLPVLYAQVFHKSGFAIAEVPLGACIISLDDILDTKSVRKTIKLDKFGRMDKISGEISVTIQFNMMYDDEDEDEDELTPLIESETSAAKDSNVGAVGLPNELVVKVMKGKELKKMDTNLFGKESSCDPYVTIVLNTNSRTETKTTTVKKKNINPQWNEYFNISQFSKKRLRLIISIYK